MSALRIGTRGSALALTQTEHVKTLLAERCPELEAEIAVVRVSGDTPPEDPEDLGTQSTTADKRRWVDAIEDALLSGVIDLAVHSAKDVPVELAEGLELLGAPPRAAVEDVLSGATTSTRWRRGRGSARAASAERAARARPMTCKSSRCAATWTRACASSRRGSSTRSCWRARACSDSAARRDRRDARPGAVRARARTGGARAGGPARTPPRERRPPRSSTPRPPHACWPSARSPRAERELPHPSRRARSARGLRLLAAARVGGTARRLGLVADELLGGFYDPAALGRRVAERMDLAGAGDLLRRAEEMAAGAGV